MVKVNVDVAERPTLSASQFLHDFPAKHPRVIAR
jgi:hypothetical protein